MHYYIVDAQKLTQKQYERVQNELYSSLSIFRVSGEVVRITGVRTLPQLVESALQRGAGTIIAVGTDETFNDLINATLHKDIILGFIPVMHCELGNILGIKNIEYGAKAIAGRRIAELDLGVVNGNYFITKLGFGVLKQSQGWIGSLSHLFSLPNYTLRFSAVEKYQASAEAVGGLIINSRDNESMDNSIGDPTDGELDIMLLPKLSKLQTLKYRGSILSGHFEKIPGSSVVQAEKLEILEPEGLPLKAGERVLAKTPATIEILPKAIKVIVSRDRKF
jgi:diacylglycerol kinase family enzyme